MQLTLLPHPAALPSEPSFKVWASVDHAASFGVMGTANIWFGIGAPVDRFAIPPTANEERADGLWETTCFEAFLRAEGEHGYREWNFAPSTQWAAYDFASYRQGVADAEVKAAPYIRIEDNLTWWALGATISVVVGPAWWLGLSAVIEERDGTKSYWALAHPPADKPDFHDPDCFAARLA
jgi:hypothetical protein